MKQIVFLSRCCFLFLTLFFTTSCGQQPTTLPAKAQVIATTTILGDVLANIAGDKLNIKVLLPFNADPHSFEPTPRDVAAIADASVIFINGAGLEQFLNPLIKNASLQAKIYAVSEGVSLLTHADEGENHAVDPNEYDPHTWLDPTNVILWVDKIVDGLSEYDPPNRDYYTSQGKAYQQKLHELDQWIQNETSQLPEDRRLLVSDHAVFGYFARRYGFTQVGAVIPGFSTLSSPSAHELATLEDRIKAQGVRAIFIGKNVNPALSSQVTQDTGIKLIYIYTGSLSDANGPAATYLEMMRYNVSEIIRGLK